MVASPTDVATPTTGPAIGLSSDEATARLVADGPNELPEPRREGPLARLFRQLREPMAVLLMVAAAVSGIALGEVLDAIVIGAIVAANALIGVLQEGKAARALESLRAMEGPTARVRRDGTVRQIPASELVREDVVLLAAGDRVPADVRLLRAARLEIDESLLTGESLPVEKSAWLEAGSSPGGRGEASAGTLVTRGSALALVTATGADTTLGGMAASLTEPEPRTPLQRDLSALTRRLGTICVAVAAAVFALSLARTGPGGDMRDAFLAAVALAVAAVPEGLAPVVTVALALGVRRMANRRAIVRRLPAVEALGSTTVIATDKTGTLTRNELRLETAWTPASGDVAFSELPAEERRGLLTVAVLCNDATLDPPTGDPLEVALLRAAGPSLTDSLRAGNPRLAEAPFDPDRRRMATVHTGHDGAFLAVKGAPEAVLDRCTRVRSHGGVVALSPELRDQAQRAAEASAERGIRLLALAGGDVDEVPPSVEDAEHDLVLLGLIGLRDPLRPEAAATLAGARRAGIRVVMVTGDHPGTAATIARESGLRSPGERLVTGDDVRAEGLTAEVLRASVFARMDPKQKLDLVDALHANGEVVAVTGDGVNDAPALRRADIGVAMGRSGSDVAREAADMVVTDDDLATIVAAVREGRGIYDNIRKLVDYLVAGNLSEVTVVVVALLLFPAIGVPLLPLQLLWVNLLTDGLPALALGVDPVPDDLMQRPPRPPRERLLGRKRLVVLGRRAILIAGASLGALALERFTFHEPWPHARAVMFTVLVLAHLLMAYVARRPARGLRSNLWLVAAVGAGIVLQLTIVAIPAMHGVFGTATLLPREWLLVAVAGASPVAVMMGAQRAREGSRRRRPSAD